MFVKVPIFNEEKSRNYEDQNRIKKRDNQSIVEEIEVDKVREKQIKKELKKETLIIINNFIKILQAEVIRKHKNKNMKNQSK